MDKVYVSRLSLPGEFCPKIVKELAETALKLLSIVAIELWQNSERLKGGSANTYSKGNESH